MSSAGKSGTGTVYKELGPRGEARDILELGMKLSVPYNQNADFLPKIIPYAKYIEEVYLSPPDDVASTHRQTERQTHKEYEAEVNALAERLAVENIAISYVFNTFILSKNHDRAISFLESRLKKGWPVAAIFADVDLAKRVKEELPEVSVANSISANMISLHIANYWAKEVKADAILPDHSFNLYPEKLKQIKDLGVKVKIIPNNACIPECPFYLFHQALPTMMESDPDQAWKEWSIRLQKCRQYVFDKPWVLMRTMIAPKNLNYYKGAVDVIKLDGRSWDTDVIKNEIERYAYLLEDKILYEYKGQRKARQSLELLDRLRNCDRVCDRCGWCEANVDFEEVSEEEERFFEPHLQINKPRVFSFASDQGIFDKAGRFFAVLTDERLPVVLERIVIENKEILACISGKEGQGEGEIVLRHKNPERPLFKSTANLDIGYNLSDGASEAWSEIVAKLAILLSNTIHVMEKAGQDTSLGSEPLVKKVAELPMYFRYPQYEVFHENKQSRLHRQDSPLFAPEDIGRMEKGLESYELGRLVAYPSHDADGTWLMQMAHIASQKPEWDCAVAYEGKVVHAPERVKEYAAEGVKIFRASLWSASAELHDKRHGRAGHFDQVVELLDSAAECAQAELWLYLANRDVLDSLEELLTMAQEHSWRPFLDLRPALDDLTAVFDAPNREEIVDKLDELSELLPTDTVHTGLNEREIASIFAPYVR